MDLLLGEFEKLLEFGQWLFQDLSYAYTVLDTVEDEAHHIRHMQNHRYSYSSQDEQRPHRWDMPALTQYCIAYCWYFNDWMKAQEAQHPLTSWDFLRSYCTYLFGETLYCGSAHVAIGLGCHYWRYRPRHIEALAPDLIIDPPRDSNRWAGQLKERFPTVRALLGRVNLLQVNMVIRQERA